MGYFGELNGDLVAIKELVDDIKGKHEGKKPSWLLTKDYELDGEKGVAIENYSPSGIPISKILKELGPEGKYLDKDRTFFSNNELYKLIPKIPEILLAIREHVTKIRPKIDELNNIYDQVEEEHKIAKQAIIQFARS